MNITVSTNNSPYPIPGPTAAYGTVTIQPGGYMQAQTQTTVTIQKLVKS